MTKIIRNDDPLRIMIGNGLFCRGCGKPLGNFCMVPAEASPEPEVPDWLYEKTDCPVCRERNAPKIRGSFKELEQRTRSLDDQ